MNLDNLSLYVLFLRIAQDNDNFCSTSLIEALTTRTPPTCAVNTFTCYQTQSLQIPRADGANNQLPKGLIFSLHMTISRLTLGLQMNELFILPCLGLQNRKGRGTLSKGSYFTISYF